MKPTKRFSLPPLTRSLSARLLVLTIAFVMLGEVLIFVPSIARFRLVYLQERLAAAHEATLALEAAPGGMLPPELSRELLRHARVRSIALRTPDAAFLMLGDPPAIDAAYDITDATPLVLIRDAFEALFQTGNRVLRVVGPSRMAPETMVDVTLDEAPMRAEMFDYAQRILVLSIVLSLLTAALVYISLQWLLVRPMRRITATLIAFRESPEDVSTDIEVSGRRDEIGIAQAELAEMQHGLRTALRQRAHLAALGAAVGKINHDLRNILSTAVLVSDRLVQSDDPEVRRDASALAQAIDRAVALCEDTLRFVRARGPELRLEPLDLRALVDEVRAALAIDGEGAIAWENAVPESFEIVADRDQLFRVFFNLAHNAVEAMNGGGAIRIEAGVRDGCALIDVADTGPGLPSRARAHLFEPFAASTRQGGTGLGLAIAREVARAHGGDVRLLQSDRTGTVFRVELPLRPPRH